MNYKETAEEGNQSRSEDGLVHTAKGDFTISEYQAMVLNGTAPAPLKRTVNWGIANNPNWRWNMALESNKSVIKEDGYTVTSITCGRCTYTRAEVEGVATKKVEHNSPMAPKAIISREKTFVLSFNESFRRRKDIKEFMDNTNELIDFLQNQGFKFDGE